MLPKNGVDKVCTQCLLKMWKSTNSYDNIYISTCILVEKHHIPYRQNIRFHSFCFTIELVTTIFLLFENIAVNTCTCNFFSDCLRTTKGFNSKQHCCARTYHYLLPTFAFAPSEMVCCGWFVERALDDRYILVFCLFVT